MRTPSKSTAIGNADCLARTVAEELAKEPTLEAVTIDRARKTISVATLGRTDVLKITERIKVTLEKAQAEAGTHGCNLLTSVGDCASCSHPLSQADSQTITIQHSQDLTTIARITCPTAPKFWRWRDIPWPKVVQRDVEFMEHADEIDEWKGQMVAAVLCGCFGLLAFSSHDHIRWSMASYLLAYLAGSWFTVQEVWERLQK